MPDPGRLRHVHEITNEAELRELLGAPLPHVAAKERPALDDLHRAWLAASPFCLVATTGRSRCRSGPATGVPTGSRTSSPTRTPACSS